MLLYQVSLAEQVALQGAPAPFRSVCAAAAGEISIWQQGSSKDFRAATMGEDSSSRQQQQAAAAATTAAAALSSLLARKLDRGSANCAAAQKLLLPMITNSG
ncbi:hypothetical protein ACSSS7_007974 [Eimeria intestinalis]